MFASEIFADEAEARRFLKDIEVLVRRGQPDVAANMLESALESLFEMRHPVAVACERTPLDGVRIEGWDRLEKRCHKLDRPGQTISAISIDLGNPGYSVTDADPGVGIEPTLETAFYCDEAFAFSDATRGAMVAAYGTDGASWNGKFRDIDGTISVRGLGKLFAAATKLRIKCEAGENDDPVDQDAALLGGAFVAVRLHQAVREAVKGRGLPRPMAIIVGSNEQFPHFDAPVITRDEYEDLLDAENMEDEEDGFASGDSFASLRLSPPPLDLDDLHFTAHLDHISGTSLRQRIRAQQPVEEPANDAAPKGWFARMMKRQA